MGGAYVKTEWVRQWELQRVKEELRD